MSRSSNNQPNTQAKLFRSRKNSSEETQQPERVGGKEKQKKSQKSPLCREEEAVRDFEGVA